MSDEKLPSEESWMDRGAEYYATASGLRTAIVGIGGALGIIQPAVPAFIGAIDVALTIKAQKVAERRLSVLCQSWERELQGHDLSQVSRDYIESEEFFDLLIKAWDSAKRTRRDEKIALYVKVLTGALLMQPIDDSSAGGGYSPEDYLTILTEMSYREFSVARALYAQQKEPPLPDESNNDWIHRIGACSEFETTHPSYTSGEGPHTYNHTRWDRPTGNWSDDEFDAIAVRLQGFGLVRDFQPPTWSECFFITLTLRNMMTFLEDKTH